MISIGITFCDKDYKLCNRLLKQIEERVLVPHEVIIIDNTEGNKLGDKATYAFGYNAFQFASRYKIIKLAKGDYIWFLDGDDEVIGLKEINYDDDILTYGYSGDDYEFHYEEEVVTENLCTIDFENKIQIELWNKLIKRELFTDIDDYVPDPSLKVVTLEDAYYLGVALNNAKSVRIIDEIIYKHHKGLAFADYVSFEQFDTLITGLEDILSLSYKNLCLDYRLRQFEYLSDFIIKSNDYKKILERLIELFPVKLYWQNNSQYIFANCHNKAMFTEVKEILVDNFGEDIVPKVTYTISYSDGHTEEVEEDFELKFTETFSKKVSIILLVYDGNVNYLDSFIENIKEKVTVDYEIVIVDNREDKTEPLKYDCVEAEGNVGVLDGRRLGFEHSTGDYVWFVDIDDVILSMPEVYSDINADIYQFTFKYKDEYAKGNVFLWSKWIKREVLEKAYENIPSFFCIYHEDVILNHAVRQITNNIVELGVMPVYYHRPTPESVTLKEIKTKEDVDLLFKGFEQATEYCMFETLDDARPFYDELAELADDEIKPYFQDKINELFG